MSHNTESDAKVEYHFSRCMTSLIVGSFLSYTPEYCIYHNRFSVFFCTAFSAYAFSALILLGSRKGIRPVRKWGMVEMGTG